MADDFAVEVTREGILLRRESVEGLKISVVEGLCAANPQDPTQPRERKWYVENVLNPMIERGEIGDGISTRFDDRKMRLSHTSIRGGILEIGFGATHYKSFEADIKSM